MLQISNPFLDLCTIFNNIDEIQIKNKNLEQARPMDSLGSNTVKCLIRMTV
jgi:hypothetical protein